MEKEQLIKQANAISINSQHDSATGGLAEAMEFLRTYAGEKSSFYNYLSKVSKQSWSGGLYSEHVKSTLDGFIRYVQNDLLEGVSIERKAQIDVVSDFLEQAQSLLHAKSVHPAAPTVIIGAALEEFLRNWVEDSQISLNGKKASLDSYAKVLREDDSITKQDFKDITSWGGLRNHAAHGEWDEVSDKKRISLMLEGINLFMRKYGA